MSLTFYVHGTPAPQGSKKHVGGGRMVESSKAVKPWREAVKWAALEAMPSDFAVMTGAVEVRITFYLPRPKSHYRANGEFKANNTTIWHAQRPDLDKLVRSTLDALTEAVIFRDDSQVAEVRTEKLWAASGGANIAIYTLGGNA